MLTRSYILLLAATLAGIAKVNADAITVSRGVLLEPGESLRDRTGRAEREKTECV